MSAIIKEFNRAHDTPIEQLDRRSGMNLEKRIKRHVVGRRQAFLAVTLPGHEHLCAAELASLSETIVVDACIKGGVAFQGRLTDLYLANLRLRTAVRLLMRLARFKASNFRQLETHTRQVPWELYLPAGAVPRMHITARHSRLYHTRAIFQRMVRSITAYWSDLNAPPCGARGQTLFVRLLDDEATLSLDGSGAPLYRRGFKTHGARAPLRETTAAGILMLADYKADRPLIDPMCGAGTFSLEAALVVKAMVPGHLRDFAFMQWPGFRPAQWAHLKKSAARQVKTMDAPLIFASDVDDATCSRLQACVSLHHLEDAVTVAQKDFFRLHPDRMAAHPGLVVLNPPYGRRLSTASESRQHYMDIAAKLRHDFKGWRAALIVPDASLLPQLGLALKPVELQHGGLRLTLLIGTL